MFLGPALTYRESLVQLRGICLIHLHDLLFGNFPGKVKDSSFVSAGQYRGYDNRGYDPPPCVSTFVVLDPSKVVP